MSDLIVYPTAKLQGATFIDLSPTFGDFQPDLCPDVSAIRASLWNILTTPIRTRYRLESFGSTLLYIIGEPHDSTTENSIQVSVLQSILRWEPRIKVLPSDIEIETLEMTGYKVNITFTILETQQESDFVLEMWRN